EIIGERDVHHRSLAAEIAADGAELYQNFCRLDAEDLRQILPGLERNFVRRPDPDAVPFARIDDAGVRLEVRLMDAVRGECLLENEIRLGEAGGCVAETPFNMRMDVRQRRRRARRIDVA